MLILISAGYQPYPPTVFPPGAFYHPVNNTGGFPMQQNMQGFPQPCGGHMGLPHPADYAGKEVFTTNLYIYY